jgi:periplasmic divalent cation tolerance protein
MLYLVFVTCPDANVATTIISALVNERLVACGNIVPGLTSIYRWQGAVETASECLAIVKTTEGQLAKLEGRISELHPYEVPEIVALEASRANLAYMRWVSESVKG